MDATVRRAVGRAERVAARWVGRALRRRLGVVKTARVLAMVVVARLRGEPFRELGAPVDERDRLSRRQAGDVVLLDRALRRVAPEVAEEIVRGAVMEGAIPFLDAMVPALSPERLAEGAAALTARFFNAEGRAQLTAPRELSFEVVRCRFVELCGAVGAAHLVPLFCEADRAFFDGVRRPIALTRTRTLAGGGASCDFRFRSI